MKTTSTALIGDVVLSRERADQATLFEQLQGVLDLTDLAIEPMQALTITIGDEFQGAYSSVATALEAATRLSLLAKGHFAVRIGIGHGTMDVLDEERLPLAQTGQAWWLAREALDEAEALSGKNRWPRETLTRFRSASHDPSYVAAVNAFLLCRDTILAGMDETDARICLALFDGKPQAALAKELGISQPSISRRQINNGSNTLYQAQRELSAALES